MREIIVLDDDDVVPARPVPSQGITEEQRRRMAQQKEIALARRLAKENSSRVTLAPLSPQPRILDTSDFIKRNGDHSNSERRDGDGGQVHGVFYPNISKPGEMLGKFKREHEEVVDLTGDNHGWRSVRKRPGMVTVEDRIVIERRDAETSGNVGDDWNRERKKENQAASGNAVNSDTAEPSKLDCEKPHPKVRPKPSDQQMKVLQAIKDGKSVFLTGSAGTGKSFLLEWAIKLLRLIYRDQGIYVTASTGLAACAIGGTTLHSFAGVGLGNVPKKDMVDKAKSRREVRSRWIEAKALIVDEISMIDGEFFDKLDYVGRILRRKSQPFGGIQLIVTGDFYQLPPVNPPNPAKYFAFEAECWEKCFDLQIELQTVFRQSDEDFVGMLSEIRRGHCSPCSRQRLKGCSGPVDDGSGVVLTRLYPHKIDVNRENEQNLRDLGQPTVIFNAKDEARNEFAQRQLDNMRAGGVLSLSLGAQVMLVKNLDTGVGLVNGARGVVVGFTSPDDPQALALDKSARCVSPTGMWPLVRFACDNRVRMVGPESWSITEGELEVAKRTQLPLLLAWALSVHKCQGMTLDRVETDLSKAFDYGMIYVALSRVKSLDGLRLLGFDPSKIKIHDRVTLFYNKLGQQKGAVTACNDELGEGKGCG